MTFAEYLEVIETMSLGISRRKLDSIYLNTLRVHRPDLVDKYTNVKFNTETLNNLEKDW